MSSAKRLSIRRRDLSVSSVLLKAALATTGAVFVLTPEALAVCRSGGGGVVTCTGGNAPGISVGPGQFFSDVNTLTVSSQTLTIAPSPNFVLAPVDDGVRMERPDARVAGLLTLDASTVIDIDNLPGRPPAFGVAALDAVNSAGQPALTLNSAATITLDSNFDAPTRADYIGQPWRITDAQGKIDTIDAARPDFELIGTGANLDPSAYVFGPYDVQARVIRLALANCLIQPALPLFGNQCFLGLNMPTDAIVFEQQLNALAAQQADIIDYYDNAPPPETALQLARAALFAQSTGVNWNASGPVTINNTGALTTTGDFAFGILGRTQTLAGEFVAVGPVTITNSGRIATTGDSSVGIFANSQGQVSDWPGFGGAITVSGTGAISTLGETAYGVYAGSFGGNSTHGGGDAAGADGGAITITYGGAISTRGVDAVGVWAESRGGTGGFGKSANIDASSEAGGFGGHGQAVTVTIQAAGSVTTLGDGAHAIYAVSAAGNGGNGGGGEGDTRYPSRGGGGGNGGDLVITNSGSLSTRGDDAFGVSASSLAGGGGYGGGDSTAFRPGRGGSGGPAGRGGAVTVTNAAGGLIETFGDGSIGIFAQSVGGLGGQGGRASGLFDPRGGEGGTSATTRCTSAPFICPNGGLVTVINDGRIVTAGDFAQSVFAQSIGGGGGLGGRASGWIAVDGGDGGDAGAGGHVNVTNTGQLTTTGNLSAAIFAQSVGGGGGAGGDASGGGNLVSVSVGGDGGAGGRGDEVDVYNLATGAISTAGERSDGIFAQSVGGGGGVGGSAYSFAVGGGFAASIAIGGDGGGGGNGGKVLVENRGVIDAHGDFSNGIFAQSIGGGGGAGGSAYSFAAAVGDQGSLAVSISLGGDGGTAGAGGVVDVTNFNTITTYDFNAYGVLAQSVGGGGGVGGSSTARALAMNARKGAAVAVGVAIGGKGGAGGDGMLAKVDNKGSILTYGDGSGGVFAQSVGGGGGAGGDASAATETISGGKSNDVKVDVSVGGSGGAAGNGGSVRVDNSGLIATLGAFANGITAQSVGGGGGAGGTGEQGDLFEDLGIPDLPEFGDDDDSKTDRKAARDKYGVLQQQSRTSGRETDDSLGRKSKKSGKDSSGAIGVGIGVGGSGGAAGNGGEVIVDNTGEIITGGFMSMGVFAQSVGGGGGAGGGGSATGSGDIGIGLGLGGVASGGGDGGHVWATNHGQITTLGALAYGVFAQSVGGAGGIGGVGGGAGEEEYNLSLSIGGSGGAGGKGGLVEVDQYGDVLTLGFGAIGVLGQSVGGGGGVGGAAAEGAFANISIGGSGGGGAGAVTPAVDALTPDNGGVVDIEVTGDITTEGAIAHGVFAQSVGGGGGLAGGIETSTYTLSDPYGFMSIDTGLTVGVGTIGIAGDGGDGGNGGEVKVKTTGTITTLGYASHGIFAQSVGGGGGSGGGGGATLPAAIALSGSAGDAGAAGKVAVDHTGDIRTRGQNSVGIFAQSVGGAGSNGRGDDITIRLTSGEIVGGSGLSGAGIFVSGGKANTITNIGGRISAASGNAILATDGDDAIVNSGLIDGNVGLGAGRNAFQNQANGVFQSRAGVYLGAGAAFTNAGVISPYGDAAAGATTLVGDLNQGAGGVYKVNLNFAAPSDLFVVQGTATMSGRLQPIVGDVSQLVANAYVTVLRATTLTNAGVSADAYDTMVIDYATRIQGNDLQLGIASLDFAIPGLNPEQAAIAGNLTDMWAAKGSPGFSALLNWLAFSNDRDAYSAAIDGLNPYSAFTQGAQPIMAEQTFLNGMMSCPEAVGAGAPREGPCIWMRISNAKAAQDAAGANPGYDDNSSRIQMGQQLALGDGWFGGYSLGWESGQFRMSSRAAAQSDSVHLAGVLKKEMGAFLFAGVLDVAQTSTDRTRETGFPTPMTAASKNDALQASVRLRAAWTGEAGHFYVRPAIDLDGYFAKVDGFEETGAGAYNLAVAETKPSTGAGTFSVTGGYVLPQEGWTLHPFVELSATQLTRDHADTTARFQGAAASVSDFTLSTALPDRLYGGRIGLEALLPHGSVRLEYEQKEGDGYVAQTASAKVRFVF